MIRIALIGDRNDSIVAHRAIPLALAAAARELNLEVDADWIHSSEIADAPRQLEAHAGIWCIPGSPYANTAGVLAAIRYARVSGRPFLGTCGGFQHAMLEYAEGVWGVDLPAHAETNPDARDPVIAPLMCSLVEVAGSLHFTAGSRLARIYGLDAAGAQGVATEEYHCNYGLSPVYEARLEERTVLFSTLRVSARDDAGSVRGVELEGHPFYIATLFQPERAALRGRTPALVKAFVAACR